MGLLAVLGAGCASATVLSGPRRELVLGYDDARPASAIAFPTATYESILRFQLPEGEHRPLRLRLQVETAGQLEVNVYDSTPLETPGGAIKTVPLDLSKDDLSDGRDGRWVVADLADLKPLKGIIWVGVRRTGGTPTLWASRVTSGQAFLRDNDPTNPMGMLPTKSDADDPHRVRPLSDVARRPDRGRRVKNRPCAFS